MPEPGRFDGGGGGGVVGKPKAGTALDCGRECRAVSFHHLHHLHRSRTAGCGHSARCWPSPVHPPLGPLAARPGQERLLGRLAAGPVLDAGAEPALRDLAGVGRAVWGDRGGAGDQTHVLHAWMSCKPCGLPMWLTAARCGHPRSLGAALTAACPRRVCQAFVLAELLYNMPADGGAERMEPSDARRDDALAQALATILWQAGQGRKATVVMRKGANNSLRKNAFGAVASPPPSNAHTHTPCTRRPPPQSSRCAPLLASGRHQPSADASFGCGQRATW